MTHTLKKIITGIMLALLAHALYFFAPVVIASLFFIAIPLLIFIFEWQPLLTAFSKRHPTIFRTTFTLFYLVIPFLTIIALNQGQPRWLLLLFFYMVFMCDTGAYSIGSLFGKHKLSQYSPNKSWEGVFGGFLFSGITAFVIFWWHGIKIHPIFFIFFVTAITASAVLGDLFESYLKRLAGVKDSGNWLPGHGGLLDRFDSCIFSSIIFYLLIQYIIV